MKKHYFLGFIFAAIFTNAQNTIKLKLGSGSEDRPTTLSQRNKGGNNQISQLTGNIVCNSFYNASTTQTLSFTLTFTNTDFEYGDSLAITFPAGMTPTGTTNQPDFAPITDNGTGQTAEAFNGINGQTISWGDNDNNYGGIESLGNTGNVSSYTFDVTVNIGALTGTQSAAFHLSGDNYGANPGPLVGNIAILPAGAIDAQLLAVESSAIDCGLGNEQVTFYIKNNSAFAITNFPMSFTVNGGAPVTETYTASIAIGDTGVYTFTGTANMSNIGVYNVFGIVNLNGDLNTTNDTARYITENYTSFNLGAANYSMGFETADYGLLQYWAVEDVNQDGTSWALVGTYNYSGVQCLRKAGSAADDDDWAITGCLDMVGGTSYKLEYYYKNFELTAPCQIEALYGNGQTYTALSNLVLQNPIPTDTLYQYATALITPATSGTYYIGFHAYAAAGTSSIRLDNINIAVSPVGMNEVSNTEMIEIYPNPSSGIFNIKSNEIFATVSVLNVLGEEVYSNSQILKGNNIIDLSTLTAGSYFVKVSNGNKTSVRRIVVNK